MKLAVFDIETLSIRQNTAFVMAGIYTEAGYKYFLNLHEAIDSLLTLDQHIIYSHYGGGFDFLFLLEEHEYILSQGFEFSFFENGGSIIGIELKKDKVKIKFADSYRIFNCSLKKIMQKFDIQSLQKQEHDHNQDYIINKQNIEYNKVDCQSLYTAILKFHEIFCQDIDFSYSISSIALKYFKQKYYKKDDFTVLSNSIDSWLRKGYYGGRTEIFKPKLINGYCYDINSLYPYVMQKYAMPIGNSIFTRNFKKDKIGFYLCDVQFKNKDNIIPYLPYRDEKMKKLIFASGKFKGVYSSFEITKAIKLGYKIDIITGYYFEKKKILFKGYVNEWYKIKQKAKIDNNDLAYYISKLFQNSLYGKFGQKRERKNFKFLFADTLLKENEFMYDNNSNLIFEESKLNNEFSQVQISSYITCLARTELYKYIELLGKDHIYYCDTDSIFTDKKLNNRLIDEFKIGKMKLEYEVKQANFILPKTYDLTTSDGIEIKKRKGFDISKNTIKLAKFKTAVKNINIISEKNNFTFLKHTPVVQKSIKSVYEKRIINVKNNSSKEIVI